MNGNDYTLKDLIVDYGANNFATAFGIVGDRAKQIASSLDEIFNQLRSKPVWSASEAFKIAADKNLASGAKEVAFVTYLVGCRVGEDSLIQQAFSKFQNLVNPEGFPVNQIKKGKYVN